MSKETIGSGLSPHVPTRKAAWWQPRQWSLLLLPPCNRLLSSAAPCARIRLDATSLSESWVKPGHVGGCGQKCSRGYLFHGGRRTPRVEKWLISPRTVSFPEWGQLILKATMIIWSHYSRFLWQGSYLSLWSRQPPESLLYIGCFPVLQCSFYFFFVYVPLPSVVTAGNVCVCVLVGGGGGGG